jgi:ABC-type Zn uptake system ZnuABC Zn-binding protein ZnuA
MKKLVFALLATVVAFSVAGCASMGKGKAPPPVVTKG